MKIEKHVRLEGRHFIVVFNPQGEAQIIRERLTYAPGRPYEALFDKPRWHRQHSSPLTRPGGLYARVIAAGRELL